MKEQKGITLVVLIVTIVLMIIIASVSMSIGTSSLDSTRLKGFYTQLEIVQKRVDDVAATNESYVDNEGNTIYLKEQGKAYDDLSDTQKTSLENILTSESIDLEPSNFRYFTVEDLEKELDLSEIDYNVFIDFDNRIIIAENGITIGDTTYYILENNMYFPEYKEENLPTLNASNPFDYTIIEYGSEKYKITITPNYNIVNYKPTTIELKYKKSSSKYWETSTNYEIIVDVEGEYNIIFTDSNNSIEKTIKVESGTVTEI